MNRITITLTPEEMAAKAGLSPEAFSRLSFVRLLDTTATVLDAAFVAAKSQVFQQYDDLFHGPTTSASAPAAVAYASG